MSAVSIREPFEWCVEALSRCAHSHRQGREDGRKRGRCKSPLTSRSAVQRLPQCLSVFGRAVYSSYPAPGCWLVSVCLRRRARKGPGVREDPSAGVREKSSWRPLAGPRVKFIDLSDAQVYLFGAGESHGEHP